MLCFEKYNNNLENIRNKILNVLENKNILHGHEHDFNFCLRFFRKEDGSVDLNKTPRLYLIDFDLAHYDFV